MTNNKDFNWFITQLQECGISTTNPITKTDDSVMFFMETQDGYNISVNAKINEHWIFISTYRLLKNTKLENLLKYLEIVSTIKYVKLMILPANRDTKNYEDFYEFGFEIYLENYDLDHFNLMLDCLFMGVDSFVEAGMRANIIKISKDPISSRKTLFLS